jgi:hypothetical protein
MIEHVDVPPQAKPAQDPTTMFKVRLAALEQDGKSQRRMSMFLMVGVAVLVGLISALFFLAARLGVISMASGVSEANRFVLRDAQGNTRGVWGVTGEGATQMVLMDGGGRERMRLQVLNDGSPGVALVDSANRTRVVLAVLPDRTATLVLADPAGRTRTVLGLNPSGASTVVFADRAGRTKAGFGVDASGAATFTLYDRAGAPDRSFRTSDDVDHTPPDAGSPQEAAKSGARP